MANSRVSDTMTSMKLKQVFFQSAFFLILCSITACNDVVINSNTNDEKKAAVANLVGGPNFKSAIVEVLAKCGGCHSGWYDYNEADYVTNGLVVFGNLAGSKLYYRMNNSTQGPGPKNMPQGGGAALTDGELELVETWISGAQGG